jgi:hypothetical protein
VGAFGVSSEASFVRFRAPDGAFDPDQLIPVIAVIAACEFAVHYHIDWIKARTERTRNWNSTDNIYWVAFGGDQFLHQVTYIVIVALLLRVTPV